MYRSKGYGVAMRCQLRRVYGASCEGTFSGKDTQPVGFGCDWAFRGEEDAVKEDLGSLTHGTLFVHGERYKFILRAVARR